MKAWLIRTILLLTYAFSSSLSAYPQAPDWQWGFGIGSISSDYGGVIATDKYNNIYVSGYIDGVSADVDPGPGVYLIPSGTFIAKYDPNGNFIWVKSYKNSIEITSICIDTSCNLIITGCFELNVDLDPDTGIFSVTSTGLYDIFISKLDSSGNFIYGKVMGGNDDEYAMDIAIDGSSNIFITGLYKATCDFDPDTTQYQLTSAGDKDVFVLKLDTSGNLLWVKSMGGPGEDTGNSISVNDSGYVYSTGYFLGQADFDPGAGIYLLNSFPTKGVFISKLSPGGNFVWAKAFENIDPLFGLNTIITGSSGNIFVTGSFLGTVDFDPDTLTTFFVSSASNHDSYVTNLDYNGNLIWSKKIASIMGQDVTNCITSDAEENIYFNGWCGSGLCDFDPDPASFITLSSNFNSFICKWDSSGQFKWVRGLGSGVYNSYNSIIVDASQKPVIISSFLDELLVFSSDTVLNVDFATPYPNTDISIAKLSCSLISYININACNSYTSPSGNYTWNIAGIYTDTLYNAYGCDSVIFINLSIGTVSSSSTLSIVGCDTYVSPSGHYTWTVPGTYMDTIPNAVGCDSVMTINLTFLNNSFSGLTDTVCESFLSPSGLYAWNVTGIYHDTLTNAVGCDSVITIDLTVFDNYLLHQTVQACFSFTSPSGNYTWTSSGIYNDTLSTSNGCDSIIIFHLNVFTVNSNVTTNGYTLTAQLIPGATYQWLDCNNGFAPMSGETSNSFTPIPPGSYAVEITKNGCKDTSACYTITGINEQQAEYKSWFEIIPNPAGSDFTILFNAVSLHTEIDIIDVAGKIVYSSQNVREQELKLSVEGLQEGVYFVQVKTDRFIETKKLVVAR